MLEPAVAHTTMIGRVYQCTYRGLDHVDLWFTKRLWHISNSPAYRHLAIKGASDVANVVLFLYAILSLSSGSSSVIPARNLPLNRPPFCPRPVVVPCCNNPAWSRQVRELSMGNVSSRSSLVSFLSSPVVKYNRPVCIIVSIGWSAGDQLYCF